MVFDFGLFQIDVDPDRTKQFYKNAEQISAGCDCLGCRNYEKAAAQFSEPLNQFFTQLGIDPEKAAEVWVHCANSDATLKYGGFYHLCGTILKGTSAWVLVSRSKKSSVSHWDESLTLQITDHFQISFQDQCNVLEEGFPTPVIQLDFLADIPWVLEEPNPYLDE